MGLKGSTIKRLYNKDLRAQKSLSQTVESKKKLANSLLSSILSSPFISVSGSG